MTTFLLDIWHDLREKRLWPVALGLLVATVAIPVVMIKPAEAPPVNDAPAPAKTAALPTVSLDEGIVDASALDAFDIKDPFSAGSDRVATDPLTGQPAAGVPAGDLAGPKGGAASGSGGSGTAGGSGGSAPGPSGGSGGGTRYFTYTVDVRFGKRGAVRAHKGVKPLDLLPDDQHPVVSFMGMAEGAKSAVFFIVDPAFTADGEGECKPTEADCRFVYLGVDDDRNEQTLSAAEGNLEYTLRLDKITITNLDRSDAIGDSEPGPGQPQQRAQGKQKTLLTLPTVR